MGADEPLGVITLNFENENNAEERRKTDHPKAEQPSTNEKRGRRQKEKKRGDPELGQALRSVYQRTIDEDIPSEMLDLLGKLG